MHGAEIDGSGESEPVRRPHDRGHSLPFGVEFHRDIREVINDENIVSIVRLTKRARQSTPQHLRAIESGYDNREVHDLSPAARDLIPPFPVTSPKDSSENRFQRR